jgi:zinc-ribbon domain
MSLFSCPECGRQISDQASACPHCGYPVTPSGQVSQGGSPSLPGKASVVADLDLVLHRAIIDAHARKVLIHAEARVGLADGSCAPGIAVTFYVNGNRCSEVQTDGDGRAVLDGAVTPDFCEKGSNELVVRLGNSAKTRAVSFNLLEWTSISSLYGFGDFDVNAREYNDYYEYRCEEWCEFTIDLSPEDFVDCAGVEWWVTLVGEKRVQRRVVSDSTGRANLRVENRYTSRHYYSDRENDKQGYLGLEHVSEMDAILSEFGSAFQLHRDQDS